MLRIFLILYITTAGFLSTFFNYKDNYHYNLKNHNSCTKNSKINHRQKTRQNPQFRRENLENFRENAWCKNADMWTPWSSWADCFESPKIFGGFDGKIIRKLASIFFFALGKPSDLKWGWNGLYPKFDYRVLSRYPNLAILKIKLNKSLQFLPKFFPY